MFMHKWNLPTYKYLKGLKFCEGKISQLRKWKFFKLSKFVRVKFR